MKIRGVKCDEDGCGWKSLGANPLSWLDRKCPRCGKGIIITKKEMAMLKAIAEFEKSGLMKVAQERRRQPDAGPDKNGVWFRIDLGPLRKGMPPNISIVGDGRAEGRS